MSRPLLTGAVALVVTGLLAAAGCQSDGARQAPARATPAETRPPTALTPAPRESAAPTGALPGLPSNVRPAPLPPTPTTVPAEVEVPATTPAVLPTEEVEEVEEAEEAVDLAPRTTQPATQAATQSTTQPTTQATTAPTTFPTTQAATQPSTQPVADATVAPARPGDLLLETSPTPADEALANILNLFAVGTLEQEEVPGPVLSQGETLMTAAVRLAPGDARLARQLVEARLRVGDASGALEALEHYRRLEPGDLLAQIRYVDLAANALESADEKLAYLTQVADAEQVADEVRSHAAAMASLLLREMLDDEAATAMVERAVQLDPYNPLALQLNYERLAAAGASRAQRVGALAALLRSNVAQPGVMTRLAEELASAGLVDEANEFSTRARQVYLAMGTEPPPSLLIDLAAMQLITNRPNEARQTARQAAGAVLGAIGEQAAAPGAFGDLMLLDLLALTATRNNTDAWQQAFATALEAQANAVRFNTIAPAHALLTGQPVPQPPAEGPLPQTPLPDVVADAQQLTAGNAPPEHRALIDEYAAALANLAWIDLYFRQQPTDPTILQALELLVPEQSATLVRLKGWDLWRQGQIEAAREKLQTVADRDALARLALLLMDQAQGQQIQTRLQALVNQYPSGLVGAFLADTARQQGILVQPESNVAQVRQALEAFNPRLFDLLEPEKVRQFYTLSAEPRQVRHEFGEPMLVDVTIRNSGRDVLTVGPGGLIRPTLRLDALVRGQAQQPIAAAATPELGGRTRLRPGEKIEQTVRLDGPQLSTFLGSVPQLGLTIVTDVTTNPVVIETEQGPGYATGVAGQTYRLARLIDRRGLPLDLSDPQALEQLNQRVDQLRSGEPVQRLRAAQLVLAQLEWLAGYVAQRQEAGAEAEELQGWRQLAGQLNDALQRAASTADVRGAGAAAGAWVKYAATAAASDEAQRRLIEQLLQSPEFEARLVGLLTLSTLGEDVEGVRALVAPLAQEDPDPVVRRFATNLLAYLEQAPVTQPATLPAEGEDPAR